MAMKTLVSVLLALGAAVWAAAVLPLGGACGSDSCTKDTDCQMPLICVASACVPVGPKPDVTESDVPEVTPDGPDADGEGDGADADGDGETTEDAPPVEGDADGGCSPVTSTPFLLSTTSADGFERPVALRAGALFLSFLRKPGPRDADGIQFRRIPLLGDPTVPAPGIAAMWTLSGVELGPQHPIIELPDGTFATAFRLPSGAGPGIWIKIVPNAGTGGAVPRQVPGTDANSSEPAVTFDGTNVVVVWTHSTGSTVEIRGQLFAAATGDAIGTNVLLASGPPGTKEPRIAWGGTYRHALVYFSAADGALHVLSLDGALVQQKEDVLIPPGGESFVGYPALVWSGTQFGLAWELRGATSSSIHLATFIENETPVDHTPLATTVSLTELETGEVALAYGNQDGGEWGLAWRYTEASRSGISLVRIAAADFTIREGRVDIRPEATNAGNPSIAYNSGYYMLSWVEQPGDGNFPIYDATRGCPP
jgi:hypothetical protein